MLILKRKFLELKNFVFILNTFVPSHLFTLAVKKLEIQLAEHVSNGKKIKNIIHLHLHLLK
jgi:hypothetical protein